MKDKIVRESDLYDSTQVEKSPICRVRSQICTQYRLGVGLRFVRACHLALADEARGRSGTEKETRGGGGRNQILVKSRLVRYVAAGNIMIKYKINVVVLIKPT